MDDFAVYQALGTSRGSMQAISVTKLKKKYLWSWAIAGVVGPLIFLLVGLFAPKPPEWDPFQEARTTKDKPNSTGVRRHHCFALARRICRGIPGPRGHRRWRRFGRRATLNNHISGFTSSECCNLFGNWIDTLVFWRSIFRFLSKAFARLVRCPNPKAFQLSIWQLVPNLPGMPLIEHNKKNSH